MIHAFMVKRGSRLPVVARMILPVIASILAPAKPAPAQSYSEATIYSFTE